MVERWRALFCLFVIGVRSAPLAELAHLQTLLDDFFVLASVIADFFARRALHLDHGVLGHRKISGIWNTKRILGMPRFVKALWSRLPGSNRGPSLYKSVALPLS